MWDDRSEEGIAILSLLRGQVLRVHWIATSPDSPGFALEYEMIPARHSPRPANAPKQRGPRNQWWLEGRDDVGTEYDD